MARLLVVLLLTVCSVTGRAFAQTTAEEQFELADRYLTGEGVPKNVDVAVEWYRKAAGQGYVAAQLVLGMMYAKGDLRDSLKNVMTGDEIADAQRASRAWKAERR